MEQCRRLLCQQRLCGNGFLLGYHCRTIGLALVILGRYSRNGRFAFARRATRRSTRRPPAGALPLGGRRLARCVGRSVANRKRSRTSRSPTECKLQEPSPSSRSRKARSLSSSSSGQSRMLPPRTAPTSWRRCYEHPRADIGQRLSILRSGKVLLKTDRRAATTVPLAALLRMFTLSASGPASWVRTAAP